MVGSLRRDLFASRRLMLEMSNNPAAKGRFMLANCCTKETALLNASTLTWTATGTRKADINDEEGWTLFPNKQVLTVDAYVGQYNPTGTNSEVYNPASGKWHSAGSTVVQLWDSAANCAGLHAASFEVGPAILRPDGTVFYTGSRLELESIRASRSWSPSNMVASTMLKGG